MMIRKILQLSLSIFGVFSEDKIAFGVNKSKSTMSVPIWCQLFFDFKRFWIFIGKILREKKKWNGMIFCTQFKIAKRWSNQLAMSSISQFSQVVKHYDSFAIFLEKLQESSVRHCINLQTKSKYFIIVFHFQRLKLWFHEFFINQCKK